jgi:hypothetical protein
MFRPIAVTGLTLSFGRASGNRENQRDRVNRPITVCPNSVIATAAFVSLAMLISCWIVNRTPKEIRRLT